MANKFEQLAVWYLRLNGYLTTPNFVLHPDIRGSERTDADILAVRFPHSKEVAGREMEVDSKLVCQHGKIDFIIAEVKSGKCRLNGPWTNKQQENMHYVLRWLGMVPESEVSGVADDLYRKQVCESEGWIIRLACFGNQESPHLPENVLQLTHEHVVKFMSERFKGHADVKSAHKQWDSFIEKYYRMAVRDKMSTPEILKCISAQM
ncbi:MAG TPA: hypothetical protein VMX96_04525 [Dehalococcoidia bacterium]|nr:hypothetical protein [Dehalococcoidia bacterium]